MLATSSVSASGAKYQHMAAGQIYEYSVTINSEVTLERCKTNASFIEVPELIDGMPVRAIAPRAFANVASAEEIVCPPHVCSIGTRAFEGCINLRKITFPIDVECLCADWTAGCKQLSEVILPGQALRVESDFFLAHMVHYAVIGAGTKMVNFPHIDDALLDVVSVDALNPWIASDGYCLFTRDFSTLLRCITRVENYQVPSCCRVIADEAFAYNTVLRHVELPEKLERIGARAFSGTAVTSIEFPASTRVVSSRAFLHCKNLERVTLNEGLEVIEESAFASCEMLDRIVVPATVRQLDASAFRGCKLLTSNAGICLEIAANSPYYLIDSQGVLYHRDEKGLELVASLGTVRGVYQVLPGTVSVAVRAFLNSALLERVEFPDGLRSIASRAFYGCSKLREVVLPDSVTSIGEEAFRTSSIDTVRLPANLEHLGVSAFLTRMGQTETTSKMSRMGYFSTAVPSSASVARGTVGKQESKRCIIDVDMENARYFLESDFLCERCPEEGGAVYALQYIGHGGTVFIPKSVKGLYPNALIGAGDVYQLYFHSDLKKIGVHGLVLLNPLSCIQIVCPKGVARLRPAPNDYGAWAQNHALGKRVLDINLLAADCDSSIANMQRGYERSWRVLDRLANGLLLDKATRAMFREILIEDLDNVICRFSKIEYLEGIRQLLEVGLIDASNIVHAVDVANASHGVAVTGLLLEAKRERFTRGVLDFGL